VTVCARFFGSTQITPTAGIANLPSQLSTRLTASECPAGTTYEGLAVVNLPEEPPLERFGSPTAPLITTPRAV
jgi:hypothetical protein